MIGCGMRHSSANGGSIRVPPYSFYMWVAGGRPMAETTAQVAEKSIADRNGAHTGPGRFPS
jgi:hypothetical protein